MQRLRFSPSLNRQVKDRMRSAISTLTSTYVPSHVSISPNTHAHTLNKPGTCVQMIDETKTRFENGKEYLAHSGGTTCSHTHTHTQTKESERKRRLISRLKLERIFISNPPTSRWKTWVRDRVGARNHHAYSLSYFHTTDRSTIEEPFEPGLIVSVVLREISCSNNARIERVSRCCVERCSSEVSNVHRILHCIGQSCGFILYHLNHPRDYI